MMITRILAFVCLMLGVCSDSGAQTNADGSCELYNDGFGKISNIPQNDTAFANIRFVVFRPDADFYLEPLNDSAFSVIEKMTNIESIEIRCLTDPLSERTARLISNCRKLKYLTIENAAISQAAIPVLLGIPLELLELRCIPISNHLHKLNARNLRNLILKHCGLKNTDANLIASSTNLQYLDVRGNEYINADFILRLDSLKKLKVLHIAGAQLSIDNCHDVVRNFPELKYLNAEIGIEGEALLKSKLVDFTLLSPDELGESPKWGLEDQEADRVGTLRE